MTNEELESLLEEKIDKIEELESLLEEKIDKIEELESEISDLNFEIKDLQGELEEKNAGWLQVFPRKSDLSMKDVEDINELIKNYCKENGIHYA